MCHVYIVYGCNLFYTYLYNLTCYKARWVLTTSIEDFEQRQEVLGARAAGRMAPVALPTAASAMSRSSMWRRPPFREPPGAVEGLYSLENHM